MSDQSKARIVAELRATAQLMTLEPGVFCVFNQGPIVMDAGGLPGVRISLPPGGADTGRVRISTFRDDGWLGGSNTAALIRVDGPVPGQVLVTVYQAPSGTEAPRLQVVRLTDVPAPASAPAPAPAPPPVAEPPAAPAPMRPAAAVAEPPATHAPSAHVPPTHTPAPPASAQPASAQPAVDQAEVAVHINRLGDVLAKLGSWAGEPGSQRWIEGFALSPRERVAPADIEYQAVLGRDWLSPWSEGGQYCGSRGMSLPLLGLRVRLRGAAAAQYDVALEASFVNGTTAGPVGAGEACETTDLAALEAFKLVLVPKEAPREAAATSAVRRRAAAPAAKPVSERVAKPASPPAPPPPKRVGRVAAAPAPAPAPRKLAEPAPAPAPAPVPAPVQRRAKAATPVPAPVAVPVKSAAVPVTRPAPKPAAKTAPKPVGTRRR